MVVLFDVGFGRLNSYNLFYSHTIYLFLCHDVEDTCTRHALSLWDTVHGTKNRKFKSCPFIPLFGFYSEQEFTRMGYESRGGTSDF